MRAGIALASLLFATSALAQQTPQETPPPAKQELRMRSSTMFGTGIGMVIVGPIAALTAAAVLAAAHGTTSCAFTGSSTMCTPVPADRGEIAAGAIVLSIGATAALGGIVMIILGAERIPVEKTAWLGPDGIRF